MPKAALLDVDGTLVDSNYQHTIAWYGAFREHDITLPLWRIHRAVGMGGDQLVPALVAWDVEAAAKAGVPTLCVMTGGWSRQELLDAGAAEVYESVEELRRRLDESPLAG